MTETILAPAESATVEHPAGAAEKPPFDREELKQFGADDVEAGRNICKMLSLFFVYTVIAMGLMTIITYFGLMG